MYRRPEVADAVDWPVARMKRAERNDRTGPWL